MADLHSSMRLRSARRQHATARRTPPNRKAALLCALLLSTAAWCNDAAPAADDPALEARMRALASELRCVVCQNQTVADSHAALAADMRQQIREQLAAGQNEDQVRAFMTARFGDFVLYRPPFNDRTALLWLAPGVLMLGSLAGLWGLMRRRSRLADAAFEPDSDLDLALEDGPNPDSARASSANRPL